MDLLIEQSDWLVMKRKQSFLSSGMMVIEFPWWTADNMAPFMVRGGIHEKDYYLSKTHLCVILTLKVITNLKMCWFRKVKQPKIIEEKEKFNHALKTASFENILKILHQKINQFNAKTEYTFKRNNNCLTMGLSCLIEVYPFTWEFKCAKLNKR